MDSAPATPSAVVHRPVAHPALSRLGWLLLVLAFAAYGWLLARHVGAYAGGSDSSGYMNHARLLASGHVHVAPRDIPGLTGPSWMHLYSALGFRVSGDGATLVPTYPTGLPVMVLLAALVVGWAQAGNVVLWFHGMAGAALAYAAGRTFGLSRRASILGAVIIAGSPLYLFMAVQAMSDVPALVWTTAAIVAAWRSRERTAWALAAGAAFSVAVLIRPTNVLALAPLALCLGLSWRQWSLFLAGGVPGAVFFLLHTHAAYGKYLTTGYGDSAGLEARWVGQTLRHYALWLPVLLTPLVVAFVGLPALLRRRTRAVLVLLAWALVFAGFYSAYSCTHETWWYLRFLLPGVPALVIGALLVLQAGTERWLSGRAANVVIVAVVAAVAVFQSRWARDHDVLGAGYGERIYPESAAWLKQHLPANAVIAVMQQSGALYYYTDFTFIRYDGLHGDDFAKIAAAITATGRPLYAALFPFELTSERAFTEHMPQGAWTQVGTVRDATVWRWSPSAPAGK